jgi:putative membrane protein
MSKPHRAPQAFVIDDEAPSKRTKKPEINFTTELPDQDVLVTPLAEQPTAPTGFRWGSLLVGALFTLVSLWAGLTITQLVEDFFNRSPFLGWLAFGLACIAGFATLVLIAKELLGFARLRRIEKIQLIAAHAINHDDQTSAQSAVNAISALYQSKPESKWHLNNYRAHKDDILDPKDRVRLFEHFVIEPLDEEAHRIIAKRAKRVTLLTTITPLAALDVVLVAFQNIAMLRELATLYGGKPSTFATFRLARMVVTHLAVAGGLALSENFLHLFVGKGLLGKLSARFGEGAINGILTSRIGLAAIDVCRPIPLEATKREKVSSLIKEIASFGDAKN